MYANYVNRAFGPYDAGAGITEPSFLNRQRRAVCAANTTGFRAGKAHELPDRCVSRPTSHATPIVIDISIAPVSSSEGMPPIRIGWNRLFRRFVFAPTKLATE